MLTRLCLELDTDRWDSRKASRLQGFMMEKLNSSYVDELHKQQMHPYSQTVLRMDGKVIWQVSTLSEAAHEQIIKPLLEGVDEIWLHNEKTGIPIKARKVESLSFSELVGEFYHGEAEKVITVEFMTPTAFKQKGRYMILPDIRLICQSLMMRQASLASSFDMMDAQALQDIGENCLVTRYRIRSVIFPAEGTSIPGFMGSVTFRCFGTETMARYVKMLLRFGEFSGVGIKTGMGMGAIRIRRES